MSKLINVGIVYPNEITYNEQNLAHANFTKKKIEDLFDEHLKIIKCIQNERKDDEEGDDVVDIMISEIAKVNKNVLEKYGLHTAIVYNENNTLIQMMHLYYTKPDDAVYLSTVLEKNSIASYLTDLDMNIFGPVVIFKVDIRNNVNNMVSIHQSDIEDLYIETFVHTGVYVEDNGNMTEFRYIFNPVDWLSPDVVNDYKYIEVSILDFVLMIFHDTTKNEGNAKLNDLTQLFTKEYKWYGRLIFGLRTNNAMEHEKQTYKKLDEKTMNNIIKFFEKGYETNMKSDESKIITLGNKCIVNNFYRCLENRLLGISNI